MKKNFEELEALIAELEISDRELMDWVIKRNKNRRIALDVIPTALPLVYCCGNKMTVEDGLDLGRKSELWGIQLFSGMVIALKCGSGNDVSSFSLRNVKKFAENLIFNGRRGNLPDSDVLKELWWKEKTEKPFMETVGVLKENGLEADGYYGCIRCCNDKYSGKGVFWDIKGGWGVNECQKVHELARIGVVFN